MPCGLVSFLLSFVPMLPSRFKSQYYPGPYQDGSQGPQEAVIVVQKGALFTMSSPSQ